MLSYYYYPPPAFPPPLLWSFVPYLYLSPPLSLIVLLSGCRVRANIAFHIPSKEQKIVTVPFARALTGEIPNAVAVVVPFPVPSASH